MGCIRFLLAMLVLDSHYHMAPFATMPGYLAVKVFFIASGFSMALVLEGKYKNASLGAFYATRALRLYPPYLLALLASALMVWGLDLSIYGDAELFSMPFEAGWLPALGFLWPNLAITGQEALYLVDIDLATMLPVSALGTDVWGFGMNFLLVPQGWSLAVEMAFYLFAPFLVRLRTGRLALLLAASLGLRLGLGLSMPGGSLLAQRLFPAQLYLFAAGILAYRGYRAIKDAAWAPRAGAWAMPLWAGLLLACGPWAQSWPCQAALLAASAVLLPMVFRAAAESRADRFAGSLSYPFYLVQFLAIGLHERYWPDATPYVVLPVCLAMALALHLGLERPLARVRARAVAALSRPGSGPGTAIPASPPASAPSPSPQPI